MKRLLVVAAFLAVFGNAHAQLGPAIPLGPGGAPGGGGVTVGAAITGGTNTRVLFDDNGVVGESAGLTYTKASGLLQATVGAFGGATPGSNALAVTGIIASSSLMSAQGGLSVPTTFGGTTYTAAFARMGATGDVAFANAGVVGWVNASTFTTVSSYATTLSAASAGVLQIGTTAANALGSLNLTNLTATGTVTSSVGFYNVGATAGVDINGTGTRIFASSNSLTWIGGGNVILSSPTAATLMLGNTTSATAATAQTLTVSGSSGNSAAAALFTIAGSDQSGTTTTGGELRLRAGNGTSAGGAITFYTSATTTPAVSMTLSNARGTLILNDGTNTNTILASGGLLSAGSPASFDFGTGSGNTGNVFINVGATRQWGFNTTGDFTASIATGLIRWGSTSSFPALKRSTTTLIARLGDDSADTTFQSGQIIVSGLASDAAHTDSTVCQDTTTHQFYAGSGTLGICLGTSGRQFKTDLVPMTAGLDEIMKVKLWNYRYLPGYGDGGVRMQYGSTAQDIEAVLPDLVNHNASGEAINYDVGAFVPMALHAIQQLKADNDNIRAELDQLKRVGAR